MSYKLPPNKSPWISMIDQEKFYSPELQDDRLYRGKKAGIDQANINLDDYLRYAGIAEAYNHGKDFEQAREDALINYIQNNPQRTPNPSYQVSAWETLGEKPKRDRMLKQ